MSDIYGSSLIISFYATLGDDLTLLGQDVLCQGSLDGPSNSLKLQSRHGNHFLVPTYRDSVSEASLRTYLSILPTSKESIRYFGLSLRTTIHSTGGIIPKSLSYGLLSRRLVHRLHVYSKIHPEDIWTLCSRAGILTPARRYSILNISRKRRSCVQMGGPHGSRKVYLSKLFDSLNDKIQIDFIWISELTDQPILNIVDVATPYSECAVVPTREISDVIYSLGRRRFHLHSPPKSISGDVKFQRSSESTNFLHYFGSRVQASLA